MWTTVQPAEIKSEPPLTISIERTVSRMKLLTVELQPNSCPAPTHIERAKATRPDRHHDLQFGLRKPRLIDPVTAAGLHRRLGLRARAAKLTTHLDNAAESPRPVDRIAKLLGANAGRQGGIEHGKNINAARGGSHVDGGVCWIDDQEPGHPDHR